MTTLSNCSADANNAKITLLYSGIVDDQGKEVVLACGYSINQKYGYFIIKKHKKDNEIIYSDQLAFFAKEKPNLETAFNNAVEYLRNLVVNKK